MDVEQDREVCGSCKAWKGKRELGEDFVFLVKASARGKCERLGKVKPPHGGCDNWTKTEELEDG